MIYYLCGLLAIGLVQAYRGELGFRPEYLAASSVVVVLSAIAVNALFASIFRAPLNSDSALITGLILALIAGPATRADEFVFLIWAATLAMASKYILAWRQVHLFNPAAIALVITGLFLDEPATWWISISAMTPWVIIGGLMIVRKVRRADLVGGCAWAAMFVTLEWSARDGVAWGEAWRSATLDSPVWFLAFVMLTEPVTIPATKKRQGLYGAITGLLLVPQLHAGDFYLTPELALVIANLASIPFRSHDRRTLRIDRAQVIGPGLVDFVYRLSPPLAFEPGQYMEWTMDHDGADSRGKRRYFTLASSPTERDLRIGVKFAENGSSYKQEMLAHASGSSPIIASLVSGDFTLPKNPNQKIAMIAGGIGITPFRSMIKYLTDTGQQRDVVLMYANRVVEEVVYRDVLQEAQGAFGLRTVYVLSDTRRAPNWWAGELGRIDADMIEARVPDYDERTFYVSGSPQLVQGALAALRELGVKSSQIRTDYFSGLAA